MSQGHDEAIRYAERMYPAPPDHWIARPERAVATVSSGADTPPIGQWRNERWYQGGGGIGQLLTDGIDPAILAEPFRGPTGAPTRATAGWADSGSGARREATTPTASARRPARKGSRSGLAQRGGGSRRRHRPGRHAGHRQRQPTPQQMPQQMKEGLERIEWRPCTNGRPGCYLLGCHRPQWPSNRSSPLLEHPQAGAPR